MLVFHYTRICIINILSINSKRYIIETRPTALPEFLANIDFFFHSFFIIRYSVSPQCPVRLSSVSSMCWMTTKERDSKIKCVSSCGTPRSAQPSYEKNLHFTFFVLRLRHIWKLSRISCVLLSACTSHVCNITVSSHKLNVILYPDVWLKQPQS